MPLQPSRRDVLGPPARDVTDLGTLIRHQGSAAKSINPGMLDGRWSTPRPVADGPTLIVGGDENGGDEPAESVIGEDEDRLTLTNLRTQVWQLSAEPISETLVVRWHPDAGAGVEWKRVDHYDLSDDGGIVTISADQLTAGGALVGDVFSAQYLKVDLAPDPVPVVTLALRGTVDADGANGPGFTNITLPVGTTIGDLIVLSLKGSGAPVVVADSRLTDLGNGMWIGFATSTSAIVASAPGGFGTFWGYTVETLITNAVGWTAPVSTTATGLVSGSSVAVPTVDGYSAAVCAIWDNHVIVAGFASQPTGWSDGTGSSSTSLVNTRTDYWDNAGDPGTSPAGPTVFTGGSGGSLGVTVVGLIGPEV